jgi:hypothetical protein
MIDIDVNDTDGSANMLAQRLYLTKRLKSVAI